MSTAANLAGDFIFGSAVRIKFRPHPDATQVSHYFGVSGSQQLYGGSRGRTFEVEGCLTGSTGADIRAAQAQIMSYADGIARTLTDTFGYSWPNVVFRGEYHDAGNLSFTPSGYCQPYRLTLHGLT